MVKTCQNYIFCVIVATACLTGFSSTASTESDEYLEYESDESWVTINSQNVDLITSTTPDSEQAKTLSCEVIHETLNKDISIAFKEEITDLLATYNDWGKLLAPAPVAIGILGQLILMANQLRDFPINREDPGKVFKHIEYKYSFRATLLQISQRGFSAFSLAHRNMNAIRSHNSDVLVYTKELRRFMYAKNTRDTKIFKLRLTSTIMKISELTRKTQILSKETGDKFQLVLDLIVETREAIYSTNLGSKISLKPILDTEVEAQAKILTDRENLIFEQKDAMMKNMLKKFKNREGKLYHTCVYKRSIINLVNNWMKQMRRNRYNEEYYHAELKEWVHSYQDNFVDSNPCAQRNSQHLLDLLIAFEEYRRRYQDWQFDRHRQLMSKRYKLEIDGIEGIFGNLQNCSEIESIITKGATLMAKLKSPSIFESLNENSTRPGDVEIKEMVVLINRLRITSKNAHEKAGKKSRIVTNSGWNLFNASKHHQLDQLKTMSKTVEENVKLNTELMEIRKEKTKQILGRMAKLDITKGNIEYAIRALEEGLVELGKLKNDWEMLIQFFDKIRIFIEKASRHSEGLISILNHLTSDNPKENISQSFDIYDDLVDSIEKINEAAFLVYGIADMYVNTSNLYIMDQVNLMFWNTNYTRRIFEATKEQLKKENEILTKNATDASIGIENYIRKHENQLSEELNKRHLKIFNEYQQFANCLKNKEIVPEENKWFQIKSRLNDKVLEVSPEFNSKGYPVIQIWDALCIDNHQQMWYLSENKTIQSVSNDFCLTSHGEYNASVTVEPCENTEGKQWAIKGNSIVNLNNPTDCLNILDDPEENGALIVLGNCSSERELQSFSVVSLNRLMIT